MHGCRLEELANTSKHSCTNTAGLSLVKLAHHLNDFCKKRTTHFKHQATERCSLLLRPKVTLAQSRYIMSGQHVCMYQQQAGSLFLLLLLLLLLLTTPLKKHVLASASFLELRTYYCQMAVLKRPGSLKPLPPPPLPPQPQPPWLLPMHRRSAPLRVPFRHTSTIYWNHWLMPKHPGVQLKAKRQGQSSCQSG